MSWCNYLVVPKLKALYDVRHAPKEKDYYKKVLSDLENLENVIADNSDNIEDSRDLSLKDFPLKTITSLYTVYDALPKLSDYDSRINIFIAFMMKCHKDSYILNECDKKIPTLKRKGYKIYSSNEE